jgi:hypothetical protein
MLAAFRVTRKKDGILIAPQINMTIDIDDAIELRRYLKKKEMPMAGKIRKEVGGNLAEHLASIQYALLEISDLEEGIAWPSLDNKRMYLSAAYKYEISVYPDYVV